MTRIEKKENPAWQNRQTGYGAFGRLALILAFSLALLACDGATLVESPPGPTGTPGASGPVATPTVLLDQALPTRTPAPTSTPGPLARAVEEAAADSGLAFTEVLGLSPPDWINLGLSILFVVLGYAAGTLLIRRILPAITRRTPADLDDRLLAKLGPDLRWLVVVLSLRVATDRLTFVTSGVKDVMGDVYFLAGLAIVLRAGWRLIDLTGQWYSQRSQQAGHEEELAPLITLLARLSRGLLLVAGLVILLTHFGTNTAAIGVALALGGLAITLAMRDTVADGIAGFIILVDRPFRKGDRIEIEGESTWGDVVEIGLRTTRVLIRDNRLVIVPNSLISQNKVSNYSYPDPRYRIQSSVRVAYGTDIEFVEQLIIDTVRQMPGIVPDEEIEVLYDKMGDSGMILGVRWWIESYADARRSRDQVHRGLQKALGDAGIEMPYPTQALHLYNESEVMDDSAT